ncbi:hypothetical protein [Pontibacter sp. H249]|uniref:hypothetical protein n=1 Tax=Pontibacter sp. H249 TaxID=3133420 RepID=UPI0030BFB411
MTARTVDRRLVHLAKAVASKSSTKPTLGPSEEGNPCCCFSISLYFVAAAIVRTGRDLSEQIRIYTFFQITEAAG